MASTGSPAGRSFAYYQGPARFSVDYYLERRIGWWHRIAEVGHHDVPAVYTAPKASAPPLLTQRPVAV
jgi:hypothetical protein